MSKKKNHLNEKINQILSIEELEERLEMNTLSTLGCCYESSYCFNGNSVSLT